MPQKDVDWLFGPDLAETAQGNKTARAGALAILEGRLILYPLRSLQRPFLYATCPLILERLERDLRALDLDILGSDWKIPEITDGIGVADATLAGNPVIVEDLIYKAHEVQILSEADQLTLLLAGLLPQDRLGGSTRRRIEEWLVLMPNTEFADIVRRATPVQARIRLGDEKSTSGDGGNLWYEETLPPDCLFAVFAAKRAGLANGRDPGALFREHLAEQKSIQIGGNETVGQGYCWWTAHQSLV
jgi:CRISPR-associated protein Cmr4